MQNCKSLLNNGLQEMGLTLPETVQDQLLEYLSLLQKWNQAYNLVGEAPEEVLLARHLLDSLAILPVLKGPRVLDVGSGAGLPGIPLAIAQPDYQYVLCEPRQKRIAFLQQVITQLGLTHVHLECLRIEDYHPQEKFDSITCRAFTSLPDFIALSSHCLQADGYFIAMKGPKGDLELSLLPKSVQLVQKITYSIPQLDRDRVLFILTVTSP